MSTEEKMEVVPSETIASIVKEVAETIQREGSVRAVFGDPLKLDTRVVIPVAAVRIGLGGGGGLGRGSGEGLAAKIARGAGGGGALNIEAVPIGFLFEREGEVSFRPIAFEGAAGEESLAARVSHWIDARRGAEKKS